MDNKIIKAESNPSQMLQPQQSVIIDARWIKSQDEFSIAKAHTSNRIIHQQDKEGKDSLIDLLAKWVYYLGLTKMAPEDLAMISVYITRSYGNLTLDELDLIIEYSIAGKLDVDTNPFGSFSPLYVSNIIGAYIRYRNKIMSEVIQRRAEIIREQSRKEAASVSVQCDMMKSLILQCYKEYKDTGEITDFFNVIYNFLRRTNRIIEPSKTKAPGFTQGVSTFVLSEDVTSQCMEKAHKKAAHMAQQKGRKQILGYLDGEDETTIKKYARNYCVCMYFEVVNIEGVVSSISINEFDNIE